MQPVSAALIQAIPNSDHCGKTNFAHNGVTRNHTTNIISCSNVRTIDNINDIITDNSNSLSINNDVGGEIVAELVGNATTASAAKNQLEQLNTMREALFSQDGWGCQHVNQDTNWEVPSSPEPANKDPSGPPMWKPSINNGTDLWESNLRNGGQPPAQQQPKPSWGHTPSSNLGGTWGEDDDGADSTSVWSGPASAAAPAAAVGVNAAGVGTGVGSSAGPQWGQGVVGVGLGTTGNNNSAGAGALPVVTPGGSSGSSNIAAPGAVAGGGGNVGNTGNGWGDPREIRPLAGGPMDIRSVDPRDPMRGAPSGDPRDMRMLDPRDPIRGDPRGISGRLNGTSEMWGHHQQISHNQLPTLNKMVGQVVGGAGTNVAATAGGIGPGGVAGAVSANIGAQWGTAQAVVGPKDISKQISGWEEPSPPPQRRNIPNYDDGTSLWGQQTRVPGGGTHWKDMTDPMNRSHLIRQNQAAGLVGSGIAGNNNVPGGNPNNPMTAVVGPQARLAPSIVPSGVGGQHKPDGTMWVHPSNSGRNPVTSWGDESHSVGGPNVAGTNWADDKPNAGLAQIGASSNSWSDNQSGGGWGNKQSKLPTASATSGWSTGAGVGVNDSGDISTDWSAHGGIVGKSQQKLPGINVGVGVLNPDMIKQSKQYRILVDSGFKKEDVERALVSANMNIEEAADILRANSSLAMEGWRRHDETLGSYADHSNSTSTGGFPGRYPVAAAQPSMSFPPNNLMGGTAVTGGSNNPNIAALQVQKYLSQVPHTVAVGPQSVNSNASVAFGQNAANAAAAVNIASNTNNQPSGQQIRMLGQQIQLAIHSGFISSQILTQPLTPNTLNLLNQLLSTIKHLQAAQQSLTRGNSANPMAVNVAIAKYKQQIQNLQSQINQQQAIYIKQQNLQQNSQQQQHPPAHASSEYLRGHDAITAMQGSFSELNLNKPSGYQGAPNQQSRLNQWKLPVLEKDMTADSTDFSRAPGATKQNLTSNSNNMGPLGLQNDGTWSTGRNIADGWPDPSPDNENKDWSVAQPSTATTYTDLVQEFEPGKPWKGSQIKNIEDDPSITPGSVARSPLSINPTPKDADIFANPGKNSPTDLPLSLTSSTWSFTPNQNFQSWADNTQPCATSELWASPLNKAAPRGPPPGLSTNKSGSGATVTTTCTAAGNVNGWLASRGVPSTNTTWTGGNTSWASCWLLLKNLTAQIDGPTLRTLCMQHGPLVSFHLYLNQGIALCKYATREEANKAQMALNNCVLGNTTIFAESPSENEVQNILQHLPQAPSSTNSAITPSGNNGGNGNGGSGNNGGGSSAGGNAPGVGGGGGGNNGSNGNGGNNGPNAANLLSTSGGNNGGGGGNGGPGSVGSTSTVSTSNVSSSVNGGAGGGGAGGGAGSTGNNGGNNVGKNTSNCGNNSAASQPNVSSVTTAVGNNSTWRQTTPNQAALQGQARPTGRESDFDYISQFVCSIVDD
ncbi:protein Gawky isoform X2 [Scaptodrosophila lebanonensis]|uniref:Protein Gawky isoform X2 n=1 Tax=Drosophila lebanonensis TaxID=7225 RepID=A0A6J2TY94_DROLE|nr:protein Gawky isoform X2 [Scaptodrosophila lebanonensis]